MSAMRLVLAAMTAAVLVACGGGDGDEVETPTETAAATSAAEAPTAPPADGDAILIETRVTDARTHTGEVVAMYIGESAYCRGGKTSGGSDGAVIATTLDCPEGTLKVQFAPTQPSFVQGATWEVASSTGSFKGLRAGGSMVALFVGDDPDVGREIFTGTVGD